jgi:hypothetical protein
MKGVWYNVGRRLMRGAAAGGVALLLSAGATVGAQAADVTSACSRDYDRYCSRYSIGTPQLKRCMESNRRSLSRRCINALVDAGDVPRKYTRRR